MMASKPCGPGVKPPITNSCSGLTRCLIQAPLRLPGSYTVPQPGQTDASAVRGGRRVILTDASCLGAGALDVVEDENVGRTCLRFEAKAELVVQVTHKLRKRLLAVGIRTVNTLGTVLEAEIVGAGETGLVEDGTVQVARHR